MDEDQREAYRCSWLRRGSSRSITEAESGKQDLLGKCVFRVGVATGEVDIEPANTGADLAGMAIARAVRLEAKATAG